MKSQPLKNGMTPLIQLRRSWWTITTCLREVIYWKGSTKSNSQTLTCYCSEWRRTPSGFYFGTAQAEWFWGWLDVSQLHFLFIPKTFLCLLHTPFGIRSPKVLVVVSAWTELVLDLTNFTSGGSNAGVRILKASTPMPFYGGMTPTWEVDPRESHQPGRSSSSRGSYRDFVRWGSFDLLEAFGSWYIPCSLTNFGQRWRAQEVGSNQCWGICVLFGCFWGLPSIDDPMWAFLVNKNVLRPITP